MDEPTQSPDESMAQVELPANSPPTAAAHPVAMCKLAGISYLLGILQIVVVLLIYICGLPVNNLSSFGILILSFVICATVGIVTGISAIIRIRRHHMLGLWPSIVGTALSVILVCCYICIYMMATVFESEINKH